MVVGTIGTADKFCVAVESFKEIRDEFGVESIEMEGAAVAQVCLLDKIPFIVIRGISDTPNGNNHIDFHTYLGIVSKQVAEIINEFFKM